MKTIISDLMKKQLLKTDKSISKKILKYLKEIEALDNPRSRGKGLKGNLSAFWRYRVGDLRIICEIRDFELVIEALYFGNRKDVYKN